MFSKHDKQYEKKLIPVKHNRLFVHAKFNLCPTDLKCFHHVSCKSPFTGLETLNSKAQSQQT